MSSSGRLALLTNCRMSGFALKLDKASVSVACWHNDPDSAERDQHMVDLIHLADKVSISLGLGVGDDGMCYKLYKLTFERMNADEKLLQRLSAATLSKMDLIQEIFNLENGGCDQRTIF